MTWPIKAQVEAERRWFWETADRVARECNGSLVSGRRSEKHNQSVGGDSLSLHMQNLAGDYEFDSVADCSSAWSLGRSLGLHGYEMSNRSIHWQSRPKRGN